MDSQQVQVYEQAREMSLFRDPESVLQEARQAAKALTNVLALKKNPVVFNDEQYLEFEDWQTLGRFFGLTAKATSSTYVNYGGVEGFEAKAVVLNNHTGMEVTAAESMCLNDEEKWSARTKYEWHFEKKSGGTSATDPGSDEIVWEPNPKKPGKNKPKKVRVKAGEERVPLFQLRSMAQTRACSKALRNVLAWVVVLAGYQATPAEEMPDYEPEAERRTASAPERQTDAAQGKPAEKAANGNGGNNGGTTPAKGGEITDGQRKRFYAIQKGREEAGSGWNDEHVREMLADHGIKHSSEIPKKHYDGLVAIIEKKTYAQYIEARQS